MSIMWHEARKQEKKTRCLLVDYEKRAQRRKDNFEKIVSPLYIHRNYYLCFYFSSIILESRSITVFAIAWSTM